MIGVMDSPESTAKVCDHWRGRGSCGPSKHKTESGEDGVALAISVVLVCNNSTWGTKLGGLQ